MDTSSANEVFNFFSEIYPNINSAFLLHDYCQQDKIWRTKDKKLIYVDDIDMNHANNLIKWLEARADLIKIAADCWWMCEVAKHDGGEQAHLYLEQAEEEVQSMSPMEYLSALPLYQRLKQITEG